MTKILIVDDHPLYREGLMGALSGPPMRALVLGADSVGAGLTLLDADSTVELVLVDFKLKGEDGIDGLRRIGAKHPTVARMLISGEESTDVLQASMRAGAQGFLVKSLSISEMLKAIRRVLDGGVYWSAMPPVPHASPGEAPIVSSRPYDAQSLTIRQLEVLQLLGEGRSNQEIAAHLGIAERTAKAHLAGIFEALGVDTRLKALVRAGELGLIRRS